MMDFAPLGLAANSGLFALAAALVWVAGSRLTRYADAIRKATGLGQAVIGVVLLAGVTSLPEIGVVATAAVSGAAQLAVNNLFGSIAVQVMLLAIVDFAVGRRALTAVVPDPSVMLEGSLNVILIALAAGAMVVGDVAVLGVGLWSWIFLAAYVACVRMLSDAEGRRPWLAARGEKVDRPLIEEERRKEQADGGSDEPLRKLLLKTAAVAAAILVAGFVLAQSGGAIAEGSGLGRSFVGFVLVAFATSLPELSAALAAARRGLYTMAISDILGTNLLNIAMIFLVDLLDPGGPVLNRLGDFAVFGALLAVVLTGLFLAGLAERRDKAVLRMGYDSILVLVVYVAGVALLYTLRGGPGA
jgi:cation:H+ antiporter